MRPVRHISHMHQGSHAVAAGRSGAADDDGDGDSSGGGDTDRVGRPQQAPGGGVLLMGQKC